MAVLSMQQKPETTTAPKARLVAPPIPLERPKARVLSKGQYKTFSLRVRPEASKSPTYDYTLPFYGNNGESPEEWLIFQRGLKTVLKGQNVDDAPTKFAVARGLLLGDALSVFENKCEELEEETEEAFDKCLMAVTISVFPQNAVLLQKRFMRRHLRKPRTTKTRDHVARLVEMNNYLPLFPPKVDGDTVTAPTKLPEDELLDLMEYGVPKTWQNQMTLQDFDPLANSLDKFVNFCERLERVEDEQGPLDQKGKSDDSDKKKKSKKRGRGRGNDSTNVDSTSRRGTYCMLHGEDCGHNTDGCKTLKAQAKRLKADYKNKKDSYKKKDKEEIHSLAKEVGKVLSKGLRKRAFKEELKAFENLSLSDDSDASASGSDASNDDSSVDSE